MIMSTTTTTNEPLKPTCTDQGREHPWEARDRREHGAGMLLFTCKTCGAWGWAAPRKAWLIRAYKNPFADPRRRYEPPPEPTVLTAQERTADAGPAMSAWVDRRGDLLPRKRGKDWYTPRFGLSDWDCEPTGGQRSHGATRDESRRG